MGFHLHHSVQFHDGSEVDAAAVRFSFERLLTIGKGPAGVFKRMGLTSDHVRVVDPHTVEVRLGRPYGSFLAAIPTMCIVNPAVIKAHEENDDWAEKWLVRNEAGSGAFSLVKYDTATGFVMARFPGHWRGWREKYVDEVEIRLIRETSSRVLALMKGDIHSADTNLPPDQLEKLERNPRLKVTSHESMSPFYIRMHNQREPFTDINVRKAFNHASTMTASSRICSRAGWYATLGPHHARCGAIRKTSPAYDYDLDKAGSTRRPTDW